MVQPALSSPTTLRRGTVTLSKKVSQNGDLPEISTMGRVETPGRVHVEQHEADAGRVSSLCSVRTRQKIQSASSA